MAKTCTKTFIKRGQEIKKENLKANGIYAVRYVLPAAIAAQYNTVQEQWGLVQLDKESVIIRTWNVDDYNEISSTSNHQPWFNNLTFFRSSAMERQFIGYYDKWLGDHIYFTDKLEHMSSNLIALEAMFKHKLSHPMHRFADFVIRVLNRLKK